MLGCVKYRSQYHVHQFPTSLGLSYADVVSNLVRVGTAEVSADPPAISGFVSIAIQLSRVLFLYSSHIREPAVPVTPRGILSTLHSLNWTDPFLSKKLPPSEAKDAN